jgi:CHAD domain-containing protein
MHKVMSEDKQSGSGNRQGGLAYWMKRVLAERGRVGQDNYPEAVHDLRVALRQCRMIAGTMMVFDPGKSWKEMRRESRRLFRHLGKWRDAQIMMDWACRLGASTDPASNRLREYLSELELQAKHQALKALQGFDLERWMFWGRELPKRVARLPRQGLAIRELALEYWQEAHSLHRRALRDRTQASWHRLRIALKRFRYLVENLLPRHHNTWGGDVKELQNLLGDVHDLSVFWQTVLKSGVFIDRESRQAWGARVNAQRNERIVRYREKMMGTNSLWPVWRAALPPPSRLRSAGVARFRVWASFRDPDFGRTRHAVRIAQSLWKGLIASGLLEFSGRQNAHHFLRAAAFMRDVGRTGNKSGRGKKSGRMISEITLPMAWTRQEVQELALIVRCQRGPLPQWEDKALGDFSAEQLHFIMLMGGILRLSAALVDFRDGALRSMEIGGGGDALIIYADGYDETDPSAEKIARARHLLEIACRRPIIIHPGRASSS